MDIRKNGATSNLIRVALKNSTTGAPLTGLTSASSGLIIGTIADNEASATAYTVAGSTIETITTLGTFAAPTSTKARFKEVDATNHPGLYEIQIADARFAVSNARKLVVSLSGAANLLATDYEIALIFSDLYGSLLPVNTTQLAGQAVSAAAGVTFPSSVASPTNITAGTIATVTNLTNAPTSGDLTAAMKTSVQTAATAATPTAAAVTGNVGGNVVGSVASVVGNVGGNVVGSVASVTAGVVVTTNNDKTGYALAADARITKNVALSNFGFLMVDGTDFATPKTGVTITATISKDGGSFASCSNAAVEIANGWYRINLTQSEMNADVVLLSFTGTGAAARNVEIFTQPAL